MSNTLLRTLTTVGALGAGVTGGVYFAFSTFIMSGLRKLPAREGLAAMQAVNKAAPSPPFMTVLFGSAALAVGLVVVGVRRWGQPGAWALVGGSALYLVSTGITVAFHVPRNDALAKVSPSAPDAVAKWTHYADVWTSGNHVRAIAAIAGAALLTIATMDTEH